MALRVATEKQLMCRPWWRRPPGHPALPSNHKHALHDLRLYPKSLETVPHSWASCIRKRLDTVIEIHPRSAEFTSRGPNHGGTEDYVGPPPTQHEQEQRPSVTPHVAAVPLSVGAFQGETLFVGTQLASKSISHVSEAVLLGAEFLSFRHNQGRVTTVCFSPVTGRVFVRFPAGSDGLAAQGLPALNAVADSMEAELQGLEGIEAFMLVSAAGSIMFGRRCIAGGQANETEWTGKLEPEFLPLSDEIYASLTFQIDKLHEMAKISIMWAGQELPDSVTLPASHHSFDGIWCGYEW